MRTPIIGPIRRKFAPSSVNRKFPRILTRLRRLIVGVLEMSAQACFTNVLVAGHLHKLKEVRHAEVMGTQHD